MTNPTADGRRPSAEFIEDTKMSEEMKDTQAETSAETNEKRNRRAEKVGVVVSNKMMKTIVVRVDRLVKHPKYKRYVRRRTKFMAHSEMECNIGDKVRIVETRPLSAHKRWRVVEILQKAVL
jgi:small subunit ribosomal protein S17